MNPIAARIKVDMRGEAGIPLPQTSLKNPDGHRHFKSSGAANGKYFDIMVGKFSLPAPLRRKGG